MIFSRYKSIFIFALVCLALYQTSGFWFGYFNNEEKNAAAYEYGMEYLRYTIKNMYINDGNERYYNMYGSECENIVNNALKDTVEKGVVIDKCNYDGIPHKKNCIVYELGFDMPAKEMKSFFYIKKNFENKIGIINRIEVIPDNTVPKKITVRFVNKGENKMCCFEFKDGDILSNLYKAADMLEFDKNEIYCYTDKENKNFIPCWEGNYLRYKGIKTVNPVESDGGILLMSLENNVNMFFENPALKRSSIVNNVYTYTDDNAVVKYYTNGILEYSNYAANNTSENDFYSGLISAVNFVKGDNEVSNDFYISKVENMGKRIRFGFNYRINNINIELAKNYGINLGIRSFIEITLSDNNIIKYSRLIYNFENTDKILFANVSAEKVLEKTGDKYCSLLFLAEDKGEINDLVWLTDRGKTEKSMVS